MKVKPLENTFKAWIDPQAGSNKLVVTGEVECPTHGLQAQLVEVKQQGLDSSILVLSIRPTPLSEPATNVSNPVPVRFEEWNNSDYDRVIIEKDDGSEFVLDVTTAQ